MGFDEFSDDGQVLPAKLNDNSTRKQLRRILVFFELDNGQTARAVYLHGQFQI